MSSPPDDLDFLSLDDVLKVAEGVLPQVVIGDLGLLDSAVAQPQTFVFGVAAYPSFAQKCAALMYSLARNHPLVDGNKRLAWAATRVFCLLNGKDLRFDVDAAEEMVLGVASGAIALPDLATIIEEHLAGRPPGSAPPIGPGGA